VKLILQTNAHSSTQHTLWSAQTYPSASMRAGQ
jgi:hypothetical protein